MPIRRFLSSALNGSSDFLVPRTMSAFRLSPDVNTGTTSLAPTRTRKSISVSETWRLSHEFGDASISSGLLTALTNDRTFSVAGHESTPATVPAQGENSRVPDTRMAAHS